MQKLMERKSSYGSKAVRQNRGKNEELCNVRLSGLTIGSIQKALISGSSGMKNRFG